MKFKLTPYKIKQAYNFNNEENKLTKAALALDRYTDECDEYLESLIEDTTLYPESLKEFKGSDVISIDYSAIVEHDPYNLEDRDTGSFEDNGITVKNTGKFDMNGAPVWRFTGTYDALFKFFDEPNEIEESLTSESIENDLEDISLYYKEEAIHNLKDSEFWNPEQWGEDEETWLGSEEEFDELLETIEEESSR